MEPGTIGLICGIVFGLILALLIAKYANTDGKCKTEYDERQKIVRGDAYKYAFWTLIVSLGVLTLVDLAMDIKIQFSIISFVLIILAILVLSVYCIFKGAYWGQNSNKKRYIIVLIAGGLLNFFVAVAAIVNGEMLIDGKMQPQFLNLLCGVLMTIVGVAIAINSRQSGEEEQSEES